MTNVSSNTSKIKDARDLIGLWPSLRTYAEDIGVPYVTAQVMKHRNSIGVDHWAPVIAAADQRGFEGITLELLFGLRSQCKASRAEKKKKCSAGQRTPARALAG